MMKRRLIDADKLKKDILENCVCLDNPKCLSKDETIFVIENIKAVDAAEEEGENERNISE